MDRKGVPGKYMANYAAVVAQLAQSVKQAKTDRAGMFEFGDVEEDD